LVRALIAQTGAILSVQARLRDDLPTIVKFAEENPSNLLLISGGASVGEHDFGARALRELNFSIHFDRVNLRPGKPLTFASQESDQRIAFVIPGNPVSHFVCFHVAVRSAIERLQKAPIHWRFLKGRLASINSLRADPRDTFWPAQARVETDGTCVVSPRRWSSSGDTFSLVGVNALIHIPAGVTPNSDVPTLLLNEI
jgi:molybdopterin molybdotransferase